MTAGDHIWYAGYGSNLDVVRFGTYLQGGRAPGTRRDNPGARDTSAPLEERAMVLPGALFFGWESQNWGGGAVAFYDPTARGQVYARAFLITRGQFADVAAQEMHRDPDDDLDLSQVLADEPYSYGPGHYETLHLVGELDGRPVLTFTTGDAEHLPRNSPGGAYVATIVRGLRATHGLDDEAITAYLAACEGMETWAPDELGRLVAGTR
ncbi:hypothetical protein GCM10011519_11510 [Marmoricola endophyticus]|uniref:Histone deacetylase n=1 Tax=Marmoricola endophyticus TaxID=2040280 RepID=A0A917F2W9_9ACTN|nr:histone deacetylase [Marmoricola endophyticus]GGF39575.1 hypothetical protein GCM10011519_11510 [Marmoricola endophyticus]